jgi:hypothetical protein
MRLFDGMTIAADAIQPITGCVKGRFLDVDHHAAFARSAARSARICAKASR